MHGHSDLRLDRLSRLSRLLCRHHVRSADRQQGDIALDVGHLGDVIRVPGKIDALLAHGYDIAVVQGLFGMKGDPGTAVLVHVVRRHRLDGHLAQDNLIPGPHHAHVSG